MTSSQDKTAQLAALRAASPSTSFRVPTAVEEPTVDLTQYVKPYLDAGFHVISVVGSRPTRGNNDWDPRQPYSWAPEALEAWTQLIQPKLQEAIIEHENVVVIARPDDASLGMAALAAVSAVKEACHAAGLSHLQIFGVPVLVYDRPGPITTPLFRDCLEAILAGGFNGCIQNAVSALDRPYSGDSAGIDYRAVDLALAMAADRRGFTYGASMARQPMGWEAELLKQCNGMGIEPSNRYVNLHTELTQLLDPTRVIGQTQGSFDQTRTAEGLLASLSEKAPHPGEDLLSEEYDGGEVDVNTGEILGVKVKKKRKGK